jgi:hypothetical protein
LLLISSCASASAGESSEANLELYLSDQQRARAQAIEAQSNK